MSSTTGWVLTNRLVIKRRSTTDGSHRELTSAGAKSLSFTETELKFSDLLGESHPPYIITHNVFKLLQLFIRVKSGHLDDSSVCFFI